MTLQKFQHVPNEIQAIQFTGDNVNEIWEAFSISELNPGISELVEEDETSTLILTTTHGDPAPARAGDWIVPDSKPHTFYPIKDEVMKETYLPVDVSAPRSNLNVAWPRVAPEGTPITKKDLKAAWSEFMTPLQEAGRNKEPNIKTLLAVLRHMYGAMPDDKE